MIQFKVVAPHPRFRKDSVNVFVGRGPGQMQLAGSLVLTFEEIVVLERMFKQHNKEEDAHEVQQGSADPEDRLDPGDGLGGEGQVGG